MTPRVKICGVTRLEDAELAASLGASAVGLNFWNESPRMVSVETAREIARALPPFVARVGVFVNEDPDRVAEIVHEVGLDAVQLHGDDRVDDYREVHARLIRAVTLDHEGAEAEVAALPSDVTPLVDAHDRTRRGGTGRTVDWDRAAVVAAQRSILLAGGLTPANVAEAIQRVRPWGVDVASGVEERPGVKSAEKLRQFFAGITGGREEA
jgi:phosphoribosylanthranilate isomerase